jgi:hypothetical protein
VTGKEKKYEKKGRHLPFSMHTILLQRSFLPISLLPAPLVMLRLLFSTVRLLPATCFVILSPARIEPAGDRSQTASAGIPKPVKIMSAILFIHCLTWRTKRLLMTLNAPANISHHPASPETPPGPA